MKKYKFLFAFLFLFTPFFNIFAAKPQKPEQKDWRILLEAQNKYDSLDYSSALIEANRAKSVRLQNSVWAEFILNEAISPMQVRKGGDAISDVLPILEERYSDDAVEVIRSLLKSKSAAFFDNSMKKLIEYVTALRVYPEADYLCGKVYQSEGEYDLAMRYYDSAVKNADFLDIYEIKYEILYTMAEISYQKNEYQKYEEYLLNILKDDIDYYQNENFRNALLRTIDSKTDKEPVEKFFLLYRANKIVFSKAYYLLAKYYQQQSNDDKAIVAMSLNSLAIFTHIYEIVKIRNPKYSYDKLNNFFIKFQTYDDIKDWTYENNLWDSLIEFAQLAKRRGDVLFSNQLLAIIKESSSDDYWKNKASQLYSNN